MSPSHDSNHRLIDLPKDNISSSINLVPQVISSWSVEDSLAPYTDPQALSLWLDSYLLRSPHTRRTLLRESERFLIFLEHIKGLSSRHLPQTTTADANAYLAFLLTPLPFTDALLARYGRKSQPFRGPLSRSSIRQTIVILHHLFEALRHIHNPGGSLFLQSNPWVLVRDSVAIDHPKDVEQALSPEEWQAVLQTVESLPRNSSRDQAHYHRSRWLLQLLYRSWLRRDEAAQLKMSAFHEGPQGWSIRVVGKGQKTATLIASKTLMEELQIYRHSLGLTALPAPGEDRPAVMAVTREDKAVTAQAIYLICTTLFKMTANRLNTTDPQAAHRLHLATPHWLRHTGISHAMELGVDPRYVQAQARHSSLKITARYDHKDKHKWRQQIEMAL